MHALYMNQAQLGLRLNHVANSFHVAHFNGVLAVSVCYVFVPT